jgi:FAD dependent oxidoreductase
VVNTWGQSTFDFFNTLYKDPNSRVAAGIQLLDSFHLLDKNEELIIPAWKNIVIDFKVMSTQELCNLGSLVPEGTLFPDTKEFHAGFTFKSFTVDQSYYLKYLSDRLAKLGVKIVETKIESIDDLSQGEYDVVVNCCGLAGSTVSGDPIHCKPIRGQVVRVR